MCTAFPIQKPETHNHFIEFHLKFTSLSIKFYLFHKLFKRVYSSSYFTPSKQDLMALCWDAIFTLPDSKALLMHRSLLPVMTPFVCCKSMKISFALAVTMLINDISESWGCLFWIRIKYCIHKSSLIYLRGIKIQ